jgi:hypothetical protein
VALLKRGLSMQEVFDRIASLICEQETYFIRLLDSIESDKRERQIKQVTKTDSESIFDMIETASPFEEDQEATIEDDDVT